MSKFKNLSLVPVADIPKAEDTPLDNLFDIFSVITQMEKICLDNKCFGLSAVQVGVPWKLFIIYRNNKFEYFLNCEYKGVGEKQKSIEGCLSLSQNGKFKRFEIDRFNKILVTGKQLKISDSPSLIVEDISQEEKDFFAVVFAQEIDHQNQVLISDLGKEIEFYVK